MKQYQYYFFDLDGTLLMGGELIPHAQELIEELYVQKKQVFFLTNHPVRSRQILSNDLQSMGLRLTEDQLITPIAALEKYFPEEHKKEVQLYVIGSTMIKDEIRNLGFRIVEEAASNRDPSYVVLGMAPSITYTELQEGFHLLQKGRKLILLNRDLLCPNPKGYLIDTGSLARLLDHPHIVPDPVVLGKPSFWMQQAIRQQNAGNCHLSVIIGDSLPSDIAIGEAMGIDTCLVLTGVTSEDELAKHEQQPTFVYNSVRDIYLEIKEQSYV